MLSINSYWMSLIWCFLKPVGCYTISMMVSSLSITPSCAPLSSLVYFKPLEGEKGGRETEDGLVAVKSVDIFFSLFTTSGVSLTRRGRTWNKAENERVKWMHSIEGWQQRDRGTAKCRRKKWRSIHDNSERGKKGRDREPDGGRGAWRTDRERERAKDGHSLTVQEGVGEGEKGTREARWVESTLEKEKGEQQKRRRKRDGWDEGRERIFT